ncbi:MAG: NAD(P)H-dependent oxidoreductase [Sulfuricaulis sp.]|uniref:NAD(P)H-dependent oxidoreductase n=1 Tax=Sulfuricaulis sp. TaxID=2003553 RepID=UPI0034A46C9D
MPKRILVILGQPQRQSFGAALAQAYAEGASASGAEVREIFLGDLKFDPTGAMNHSSPPALETDLVMAQEAIKWAEHLVFVYPIWWGTIPALLKGFIERVFLPGFAVNFRDNSPLWDKLLTGRSARLIVTLNTPSWIYRWVYGRPGHNTMKKTILEFCGIKPVRITEIGPVKDSTDEKRKKWLQQVRALGARQA